MNTSTIVLAGNTISITRNPTANNVADLIDKNNVSVVTGVYAEKPNNGEIPHGTVVGAYEVGETVTGAISGATGVVAGFRGAGILVLTQIVGTFVAELLTGGSSGALATSTAGVTPTSYPDEWTYRFPTMTVLTITMNDGKSMSIELQQVSNQATWKTGTLAGLQAAITAINAFL